MPRQTRNQRIDALIECVRDIQSTLKNVTDELHFLRHRKKLPVSDFQRMLIASLAKQTHWNHLFEGPLPPYKIGETLRIRLPQDFKVKVGGDDAST